MKKKKSYAIIGTGAVGGYCAVKLYQAGFDVHCLLRSDYSYVQKNGLSIIENNKIISAPVKVYPDINSMPRCDVVLITLKTTENAILKNALLDLLHAKTTVVLLQNGIGIEDEIAAFVEPEKIVGGSCILKVTKISPGTIKHFGFKTFEWAQYYTDDARKEVSERATEIAEDFKMAGLDSVASAHLSTIKWKKLMANIPSSGLSVVLNASTRELVESAPSFDLLKIITIEVICAAKKCGATIPDDFYESRLQKFEAFKNMEKSYPSLKDDYDAKRPMELRAIFHNALQIAKKHKVSMPLTEMLYLQLLYMEKSKVE